ncbi:MAG: TnpV protein [Oscillospiraceae bacterium]|nr:TnpV protein [Clostridia bacterium]MBP0990612.1 TnpV protein [Oscillospiraceae bacterium]
MLIEGKLPDYLADVNEQAEEMLFQLVKQMAKDEGIDEVFKRRDQLGWVQRMKSIRNRAEEIVFGRNYLQIKTVRGGDYSPPRFRICSVLAVDQERSFHITSIFSLSVSHKSSRSSSLAKNRIVDSLIFQASFS